MLLASKLDHRRKSREPLGLTPRSHRPTGQNRQGTMAFVKKSPEERAADLARAVKLVNSGKFPAFLRYKIMDHTLTLKVSGSTDKGSVTYSSSPGKIEFLDPSGTVQELRINRVSVSILGHDAPADDGLEAANGSTWG